MSSHQLAIAKASFSAGLLRPDPTSISRDEIAHFHSLLNLVAIECSPTNIQKCKRWVLCNITPSAARSTGFGKYLIALSISYTRHGKPPNVTSSRREPSAKRKSLHLLYLVNDLLHHAKIHTNDASVSTKVQPLLVALFSSAASFRNSPKHQRKLQNLIDIWDEKQYYSTDYMDKLRETVRIAPETSQSGEPSDHFDNNGNAEMGPKPSRGTPFVMPASHGDQGTPWYDLPAGNLMPHIVPHSARPISPALVKPLRFVAGPADETLANAVRDLLRDVNSIFGVTRFQDQDEDNNWDIDELGQLIIRDDVTGELLRGEGYYGWSKAFCEKMKRRQKGLDGVETQSPVQGERRGRSQSHSRSRSSSRSSHHYKRRRYSESDEDRSTSRSRGRPRRSWSHSRSPSRERDIALQRESKSQASHEGMPRSTSRGKSSREVLERSHLSYQNSDSRSLTRTVLEASHSTLPDPTRESNTYEQNFLTFTGLPQDFASLAGHQLDTGVIHIPPPPPPQYRGQWPPPPPLVPTFGRKVESWPNPPPRFIQAAQNWQATSYRQPQTGGGAWSQTNPHGENDRGDYGGRGRNEPNVSQMQYSGGRYGYNGYRGSGRGRGQS